MIRRPPRSTQSRSSAASDVYKRQAPSGALSDLVTDGVTGCHLDLDDLQRSTDVVAAPVSYTRLRAHETVLDLVCRLLLEKKKKKRKQIERKKLANETNTKKYHEKAHAYNKVINNQ